MIFIVIALFFLIILQIWILFMYGEYWLYFQIIFEMFMKFNDLYYTSINVSFGLCLK